MKKMTSTRFYLMLALVASLVMLTACSSSTAGSSNSIASSKKQTNIEFWYHDGNPISKPIYEELIKRFEAKYPEYTVKFVGLPVDAYLQKYNTAVVTQSVPDVISIRDMDVANFVNQKALMPLDELFADFPEKDHINPAVIKTVRASAIDKKLFSFPVYITADIAWANTKLMKEKGVEIPKTMDEFLAASKKYADPSNGKFFYSLRGGTGSLENLFDFIFTYADQDKFFDEEGNSVLDQPIFAEALDVYAGIYWNKQTSESSLTNGFKEMVAEFGSGNSMYINHNSSSKAEHLKNLGEGNFQNVLPVTNAKGNITTKDLSYTGFSVMEKAKNKEGAKQLVKYLMSAEAASYICEKEGRVPINDLIYKDEWYKADPYIGVYRELMEANNVKFLTHPIWLASWNEFRSKYEEPGFQAVLLKGKKSADVLKEWATYLTEKQKEYLKASK